MCVEIRKGENSVKNIVVPVTIISVLLCLILIGCNKQSVNASQEGQFEVVDYEIIQHTQARSYMVLMDKDTKVMYLYVDGGDGGGLTCIINPDGSPKLYTDTE